MHLFVEQLTNVDFSYLDPERGLVGETWWASIVLEGELDNQGMVCDFGTVKKVLRQWLDTELDHRLLVPAQADGLVIEHHYKDSQDVITLSLQTANGLISMHAPAQAVTLIDASSITPESAALWCIDQLSALFPDSIAQLSLDFTPENITGPNYHYSHGLKKHDGNCQRIAHGHRSRIQIWLDGKRDTEEESYWANLWRDIYLGSREDLVSEQDSEELRFHYFAQQGEFELSLPSETCYLMDTDTTVELIADHLADQIKQRHPNKSVRIRAFEGVNKGAMAQR